jgi:hypothetical protein
MLKFKEKVKEFFKKLCTKVPSSIEGECQEFVNTYGDAVVALLVQEIDPSQVMYIFIFEKLGSIMYNLLCNLRFVL